MSASGGKPHLDRVYDHLWSAREGGPYACLDESLRPRPREFLYEVAAQFGLSKEDLVLDVGSGIGNFSCGLARHLGCRLIGFDPVPRNLETARLHAYLYGLIPRVAFRLGSIEAIPLDTASVDLVVCSDMICHVADLLGAMAECRRVLRSTGHMLLYTSCATETMEPREAACIYDTLDLIPTSMSREALEGAFGQAGFAVIRSHTLGGENLEYEEERDGQCARELLRLARMRRRRDHFIARLGREEYEIALALYQWDIYHLLGKLSAILYELSPKDGD